MTPRTIVAGAGLAGASAAAAIARRGPVVVLEAAAPAGAATAAAAGLINPFPGRRAAPAWRYDEALAALLESAALVGAERLVSQPGLLRPARSPAQTRVFRERAESLPDELEWLSERTITERWPDVTAPHGGLWVRRGAAVDMPALVGALLRGLDVRTASRVVTVGEDHERAWVELDSGERIEGATVILAPGDDFRSILPLGVLPLGRVKGQTIRVERPSEAGPLPLLAGFGYVVPDGEELVIGSTYEHAFTGVEATEAAADVLIRQAARMVPSVRAARVLERMAGVRVTVPARVSPRRLPMVGPLPGRRRLWAFVGLGSKGLLTAPLAARLLPDWLERPDTIPRELRPRIDAATPTYR